MQRRARLEMLADFLLEASVLIMVFGILDHWDRITPRHAAVVAGVSGALLALGIMMETRRPL